ncbi:uncharacterized protein LOC108630334 [Ceratina calcarata]|uniref:Uncharacterized protein LOC108630334 n=1 Tax=Ceratina calcarata TaxID=156304 RepID=A0AAJ7JBX8_9HYME|nr:uncharacterized protein LOC108630334 [Ceratina calcarata]
MECEEVPIDADSSKVFVFSDPQILSSPKLINTSFNSEQVSNVSTVNKTAFTFTAPTVISQPTQQNISVFQTDEFEKQYKPKILRTSYKPAVNVFAPALKDTAMFEQLQKNSKSQVTKVNLENSIICTNVPQPLLTKAMAKEHFNQFGSRSKITIRPKKQIITVVYSTKEEATTAYNKCGEYLGEKFDVHWTKSFEKSPIKKKDLQKNIVSEIMSNFFKSPDSEIKSELDAMMNLGYKLHNKSNPDGTPTKQIKSIQSASKAAAKLEKASAKSEKLKSDSQISDILPNATIEELQSIIQQPAYSSEDKYKVLEARDRLMRMRQIKSHTLAAAKVMIGTCPDMCPEKERLMREAKRQVAFYEQVSRNDYKINHTKAVKQYSRSSADQEEPMAHELRPVKSLKMTMSYLLHEIADLVNQQGTNVAEWYHFLWDRTRGIRKDITQQELCCPDSVKLVEQCARFHIVCSERLCAEEPSVFDKRINSDNLTKCLQSLKYMYHDLRVKGINCKNEPEFRAYIILLNLSNGNFMWDLQKLPKDIQRSAEVRFALDVYLALESNNYYKFSKLVRKTTYLNACILLRYFNQVRLTALSVLVKAYCRTTSTSYPLYDLIDMLSFEDEDEAVYFCEQLGLNISNDGLYVSLNRQNFVMSVLNIKQNRAHNVIESKRIKQNLSIGECIAGGEMPSKSYKDHKPHNSFDFSGYLMLDSINAEDQSKNISFESFDPYEFIDEDTVNTESKEDVNTTENSITEMQTSAANTVSSIEVNTDVFAKSQAEINKFQGSMSTSLIKSRIKSQKDSTKSDFILEQKPNESPNLSNIFNNTTTISTAPNIFFKQVDSSSKTDSSPFATAANKSIFSGTKIFKTNVTSSTILSDDVTSAQAVLKPQNTASPVTTSNKNASGVRRSFAFAVDNKKTTLQKEIKHGKSKLDEEESLKRMQQISETAEEILHSIQTEVIQACCSSTVKEELHKLRVFNQRSESISNEILDEVTHEICDNTLKEMINARKLYEMSVKMKNRVAIKCFKLWKLNVLKRKQQRKDAKALEYTPVWLQNSSQECAKLLYTKEQDLVIANMRKKHRDLEEHIKPYSESLTPIEVIIYAGIKENLKFMDINTHTNCYWKLVISWPNLYSKTILWHHKKIINQYLSPEDFTVDPIMISYKANQIETLRICIRQFEDLPNDLNLIGSDALFFVADASEEIKFTTKRLTKTVLSRDKLMPIPLIFVIFGNSNFDSQRKEVVCNLEELLDSGYLSTYTIVHEKSLTEKSILHLTQTGILWLTVNASPQNPLRMDCLQDFCDICLTEELWLRIFDNSYFHENLLCALKQPNFIINLHNEAVTHLTNIILDPEIFMYTKFAPEFKIYVKNQYMIPCTYEYFDDVWKNEDHKAKLEEAMSSFKLPEWNYPWPVSNTTLHRSITDYSHKALSTSKSEEISYNVLSNFFVTTGNSAVPNFVDVLLYIVKKKIHVLDKDLNVIYNKNHVKHFRTLPWWLKSDLLICYQTVPRDMSLRSIGKRTKKEIITDELETKKRKTSISEENESGLDPLATFCENSRNQIMEVDCISKKIENRLKEHEEQSYLFEEKLRNALVEGT